MIDKLKNDNYWKLGLTLFCSIGAGILLYFICLRASAIFGIFGKLLRILLPVFLGMLFAYLLNPIVKFFENKVVSKLHNKLFKDKKLNKKVARGIAIFITYLILALIVFLFIQFVIPSLLESLQTMITNIPTYLDNIYEKAKDMLKNNPEFLSRLENMNQDIISHVTNIMVPSVDTIMNSITTGITGFIRALVDIVIGVIVSVYLIFDKESFIRGSKKVMKAILPKNLYVNVMTTLNYSDRVFGGFLIAKIIASVIIGFITFIVLTIFNVPYALVISIIIGVTNIIPYFGPFIGAVPCGILLLLIDPKKCLTFVIVILIIQQFDGNFLSPKLIGNKTGIKSFWVLFSILLFGGIFGFPGMIFGVPIFAVIYSLLTKLVNDRLKKKGLAEE